jgi:hypothetical protein
MPAPEPVVIRRPDGSIDTTRYVAHARGLRSGAIRAALLGLFRRLYSSRADARRNPAARSL